MSLKLTKEQALDLVDGDLWEEFETIENEIYDSSRWSNHYECLFKDKKTEKYYKLHYSRGATEYQDEQPFEYEDPDPIEVFPVTETITTYKTKEQIEGG